MANDLTVRQAESVRLMIDASKLVNRLQDYVNSPDDENSFVMALGKITAAKILLDKALPSLSAADITAHSSPEIASEEVLRAKLLELIRTDHNIIKALAPYLAAYALPAPGPDGATPVVADMPNGAVLEGDEGVEPSSTPR